jgi:hypothetical protein
MKINRIKRFVVQHAWAGSIIGFIIGLLFGPGIIWQYSELRLKGRAATVEELRVEKELYERIQLLRGEASTAISSYVNLRDRFFDDKQNYQVQNNYMAEKAKLVSLIGEYNRLEAKIATLEERPPRFFDVHVPPMHPRNLAAEDLGEAEEGGRKVRFTFETPPPDPLLVEVENDLKALFEQYGQNYLVVTNLFPPDFSRG